ncbi:restriction endonuclease [Tenacibaculum ovolyticum]|uniref:restriction endonuclease n=1 Tax=Tenacibaculum ovolyticum TaxID=104270 RepID=UPI0007EE1D8B|nr:restriction endonuclease [Tenacibaculum ovolyticum]
MELLNYLKEIIYNYYNIIIVIFIIKIISFLSKRKFDKHKHNQKKAAIILDKINSFKYSGQKINYLRKINPFVFEELLLTALLKKGYKVKRNKKYTGDGGLDGTIFNKKGKKIIIQAKRYKSYININHVKDFEKLVISKNALKGFFIHTGKTSERLRNSFNKNNRVVVIGGTNLIELITFKKE